MSSSESETMESEDPVDVSQPITLANPSDLTLVVGPYGQSIYVCRGALCLASPVWNAMLSDKWAERSEKEVEFPDDNPEALLIVLGIAHLRFKERPKVLLYRQLVELAVICDKYDTVAVIRPFLQEWIGFEEMKVGPGMEEWIFVAWTFGIKDKFIRGVQDLVRDTSADSQGRLILKHLYGAELNVHPVSLRLPLDLLDCISQARQESITKLMNLAFGHLERSVSTKECVLGSQTCIGNTIGHLLKGLHGAGIWPNRPEASTYPRSFQSLYKAISKIKIPQYTGPVRLVGYDVQHTCGRGIAGLQSEIDALNLSIPFGYKEHHLKHIEIQAEK
ncbi:uncharacterized protein BDZ99DRAFT_452478 [Mytilinidion resinicola]|uniref:BTB domain-containing protein n=1 Tax=Mytilinidion resinicola TaxID=574789 RepID=A0A6A6Y863_9PEZI|nr:uncharacterized protein BDZ99DRAFT_452478 [Mytilinidion resinicola]KAF2804007.1 hypothetical protein BDZ99DRAFT_452478 [Mytilinidion resinicola]